MATVHSYVDTASTSGGDGTTSATTGANRAFNSWHDAVAALYIAYPNFVTSTVNPVIHCAASGGAADTVNPGVFPAFTSSATYYLVVQVDSAYRHAGVYNTAKYRIEAGGDPIIADPPAFTRIIGIQILDGVDDFTHLFRIANGLTSQGTQILYCIGRYVDKNYTYGKQWYVLPGVDAFGGASVIIANCLFYGGVGTHGSSGSYGYGAGTIKAAAVLYNVTFIYGGTEATTGAVAAIEDGYSVVKAVNCISIGYPSFGNPGVAGSDYNAADVASVPGTNSRSSQTFTFVDAVGTPKNYQLASTDAGAKGFGTDLSSDATFPISDDIAGTTRTVPWDIGAFIAVAANTNGGAAIGIATATAAAVLLGLGTASGIGNATASGTDVGAASAVGIATATASAVVFGAGNATGGATASASGQLIGYSSATGIATASASGQPQGAGSATGIANASAAGQDVGAGSAVGIANATALAAGTGNGGAATGVANATASGIDLGAAAATGVASASATATEIGAGSATGVANATASGQTIGGGAATGIASASASPTAAGSASAAGVASATASARDLGAASATGVAAATASGVVLGAGSATGVAVASASTGQYQHSATTVARPLHSATTVARPLHSATTVARPLHSATTLAD